MRLAPAAPAWRHPPCSGHPHTKRQPSHLQGIGLNNRLTAIPKDAIACPRPPPCAWGNGEARPPFAWSYSGCVLLLTFSEGIPIQQRHQLRGGLGRAHSAGNNLFVLQLLAVKRRVVIQVLPQRRAF